jgi:putative transposase
LGVKNRLVLSDAAWERMAPLIIGRPDQKGSTGRDNRMFVEGVLWIVRTGSPWRDLPEAFGDWNSVFRRFSRWSIKGVWRRIFEAMSDDPDFEYLIVDSKYPLASISMPSVISSNAASQSSSSSAASQPASKRPPEITALSSLSQPSSYGCDKCPHRGTNIPISRWFFLQQKPRQRLRGFLFSHLRK